MYDAIVVGARCAGSPTAMLLARKGYRVLLIDKATFPSDIISTHYIHQPGVARLKRWGLLERVRVSNCPLIFGFHFDVGPFALRGAPAPYEGVAEGLCPRRTVLDKILVDAALEAGVEVREGFFVRELLIDGERVVGIRGEGRGGSVISEKGSLVIGADGHHSVVARAVAAPEYQGRPAVSCNYYTYWSGVPVERVELYNRGHCLIGAVPTNDGLVNIFVAWLNTEFHAHRHDRDEHYMRAVDSAPHLAERVRQGKREERFHGTTDLPGFLRKAYGPGWALVGDAGYHRHPITATGITDAFRDAELLTEAIDAGFSGRRPLLDALADYERQRNEAVMPMYELTCDLANLEPPPTEMQQLFGALRENPAETDRFFGALAFTVPIPEFFAPENIQRIIERRKPE